MANVAADLLSDGVSVTLITAQPGGSDFIQSELMARGVDKLPDIVSLVSDPEHSLLVEDAGDIFATSPQTAYAPGEYTMIQPALVLIDNATGKTVPELTWSWKTMDYGVDESFEVSPGVELVAYRPVIADLRAAIKERRPVKLASVALTSAEIEALCKKFGDWVD